MSARRSASADVAERPCGAGAFGVCHGSVGEPFEFRPAGCLVVGRLSGRRMPADREAVCPSSMALSRCESTACHMASMLVPGGFGPQFAVHRRVSSASPGRASVLGLRVSSRPVCGVRRVVSIRSYGRCGVPPVDDGGEPGFDLPVASAERVDELLGHSWTSPATAWCHVRGRGPFVPGPAESLGEQVLTRLALYSLSSTVAP